MYILYFVVVWFAPPSTITRLADVFPGGVAVLVLSYPLTVILALAASGVSKVIIEDFGQELGRRIIRGWRRAAVV